VVKEIFFINFRSSCNKSYFTKAQCDRIEPFILPEKLNKIAIFGQDYFFYPQNNNFIPYEEKKTRFSLENSHRNGIGNPFRTLVS
jgi:hypothetical protein